MALCPVIARKPRTTSRQCPENTVASGSLPDLPLSWARSMAWAYSGVSSSLLRMYSASRNSTAETRKGRRQAHPSRASSPRLATAKKLMVASAIPSGGVESTSEVYQPRLRGSTYSATRVIAPVSSAPAPKPWTRRKNTSNPTAQMPQESAVGNRPMPTVAMPIRMMDSNMAGRRPNLSPRCPMITPPKGRAMKPTAKVAKAASASPEVPAAAKNSGPMTTEAAAP